MSRLNTEPPSLFSKLQQRHCSVSPQILYIFPVFRSILHILETFLNTKWDLTHSHSTFEDLGFHHLIFYKRLSTKFFLKICTAFMEDFKFFGCICGVLNTYKVVRIKTSPGLFLKQIFMLPYSQWLWHVCALHFRKHKRSIISPTPVCKMVSTYELVHKDTLMEPEHLWYKKLVDFPTYKECI